MTNSHRKQGAPPQPTAAMPNARSGKNWFENRFFWIACLSVTLLFVTLVRIRLLDFPLERDEGEYALMGQLILKGIPPYEMAYNMKLPGTYYLYALMMGIFGQSASGIHLGLLVVNLVSIVLLFLIGKKLVNPPVGMFAAATYALLTLAPGALGLAAHATHFNVVFGLGGLLALLYYAERPTWLRLAGSGFCFGLAFIMKQQAVFLLLFGLLAWWMLERRRADRSTNTVFKFAVFAGTMILPYLLVMLIAWISGSFGSFWHWTVDYAQQYASIKTGSDALRFLQLYMPHVTEGVLLFWLTGLLGLAALFFSEDARKHRWLILLFTGCSLACVVPGLYFRPHYFIVFFPALALLVGVALNFLREKLAQRQSSWLGALPVLFFGFMLFQGLSTHSAYFFKDDTRKLCGITYGAPNPFVESLEIARFIRENSSEQDKIAVLGSEPQICFYSNRLPATGYIYMYPLMENQRYSLEMQRDMIAEIEKSKPKFLVFVNSPYSWNTSSDAPNAIFDWYAKYQQQYNMVGLIDLNPSGKATYVWREALNGYVPKNKNKIWVHQRK